MMGLAPNAAGQAQSPAERRTERRALRAWESDGGSLAAAPSPKPARGIEVTVAARYRVGPYRYTNRACTEAERLRQEGLRRV